MKSFAVWRQIVSRFLIVSEASKRRFLFFFDELGKSGKLGTESVLSKIDRLSRGSGFFWKVLDNGAQVC